MGREDDGSVRPGQLLKGQAISDLEIEALACLMVARYSGGAAVEAGRRAERLSGHGDAVGHALWHRVGRAIHDLTTAKADQGMELN